MRKCRICEKEYKDIEESFYFRKDANKFRTECKQCLRDKRNNRTPQEREKDAESMRRSYYKNREEILSRIDRDKRNEYNAYYKKKRHDYITVKFHEKYSEDKGVYFDLSEDDWTYAKDYFGGACAYCGEVDKVTVDHVVPISFGGATVPYNLVPACVPCNASKNNRRMPDWLRSRDFYDLRRLIKIREYIFETHEAMHGAIQRQYS